MDETINFKQAPFLSTVRIVGSVVVGLFGIGLAVVMLSFIQWAWTTKDVTDDELRARFKDCKTAGATPIVNSRGKFEKCVYGPVKVSD